MTPRKEKLRPRIPGLERELWDPRLKWTVTFRKGRVFASTSAYSRAFDRVYLEMVGR